MIREIEELDLLSKYMKYFNDANEIVLKKDFERTYFNGRVIHSNEMLCLGIPTFQDYKNGNIINLRFNRIGSQFINA